MIFQYVVFAFIGAIFLHIISTLYHKKIVFTDRVATQTLYYITCILFIIFIIVFCAFREIGIKIGGTDANGYRLQFLDSTGSFIEQLKRFAGWEPLHFTSLWFVRKITDNYTIFLIILYFVVSLLLIKYAKLFELNINYFLSSYLLLLLVINSFNIQRNIFAVFLGFFVIDAIIQGKYKKATIITFLIVGFHFSAALYFLIILSFLLIKYIKGNPKYKLVGYLIISSVLSIGISICAPFILGSSRLSVYKAGGNISYSMLMSFIIIVLFHRLYLKDIQDNMRINALTILYISFMPMFVFQLFYSIMYRMMLYSLPVLFILLAEYKKLLIKSRDRYAVVFFLIFEVLLVARIISFFVSDIVDLGNYYNYFFEYL